MDEFNMRFDADGDLSLVANCEPIIREKNAHVKGPEVVREVLRQYPDVVLDNARLQSKIANLRRELNSFAVAANQIAESRETLDNLRKRINRR